MNPTRVCLGLSAPASILVARELMTRDCCNPEQPMLVVVPTKDAIRLLREQLAVCAAAGRGDGAFICPAIVSVSQLCASTSAATAPAALQQMALFNVLKREGTSRFRRLLPKTQGWSSRDWLAKAGQMQSLFAAMVREGAAPDGTSRAARLLAQQEALWQDIHELYSLYIEELHEQGLCAPEEECGGRVLQHRRIILACVPSLPGQAKQMLERADAWVEVWLHTDEEHGSAEWFDAWGRPETKWLDAPEQDVLGLASHDWRERFVVCADVECMAEESARVAGSRRGEAVCVAVCDSSMEAAVAESFARYGVPTVRPRGIPFAASGWHQLFLALIQLTELLAQRELSVAQQPLLPAEAMTALLHELILADGLGFSHPDALAKEADELMFEYLPASLAAMRARASAALSQALDRLADWLSCLDSPRAMLAAVRELAAVQLLAEGQGAMPEECAEIAASFTEQVELNCRMLLVSPWLSKLSCGDTLQLLISAMAPAPSPHPEGALSLRGWLELSYAAEPHLVLAGLHDGIVPERWPTHPYLTPRARRALGIESDESKAARDAYLLYSLCVCRPGKVHAVFSLLSPGRDPLFPSSIFFRLTPLARIPLLVEHFFGARRRCLSSQPASYNRDGWNYTGLTLPPHVRGATDLSRLTLAELGLANPMAGKSSSPSSLRAFFECPLRFWLTKLRGLRDSHISPEQRDIEAKDIGSYLHAALEHFVKCYPRRAVFLTSVPSAVQTEGAELVKLVEQELFRIYEQQGALSSAELLPRRMQHAAIRHRLSAYAALHVRLWDEGWETACDGAGRPMVEHPVQWELDGHALDFRIDRIDTRVRPDGLREYRVIDYKSGEVKSCCDKHLTAHCPQVSEGAVSLPDDSLPLVTMADARGHLKEYRWTDLQLPLYTAWAVEHFAGAAVSSAYITISKKPQQTRVLTWDDEGCPFFSPGLESSAAAHDTSCLYGNALAWIRFGLQCMAEGRCLISAEMMGWGAPPFSLFNELLHGESPEQLFLRFNLN